MKDLPKPGLRFDRSQKAEKIRFPLTRRSVTGIATKLHRPWSRTQGLEGIRKSTEVAAAL